jgi:hypothetical protein
MEAVEEIAGGNVGRDDKEAVVAMPLQAKTRRRLRN